MKRLIDLLLSGSALLVLSPILVILYWRISIKIGKPVFFHQMRPGKNGKLFKLVKFRTMTNARDENGEPLDDAERLTEFGIKLRASSLDELPGLWNVFVGNMSLVGPRPLLPEYLERYSNYQAKRHDVRPGVTGWAQVNGRNSISWEEKFELDVWYVENHNTWLDLKIICLTIKKVFFRDGISADGEATMPIFYGSTKENKTSAHKVDFE